MKRISSESGVVGYAEALDYCYKAPSGSPQVIGPIERAHGAEATGLVFQGVVYNLAGHSEFDGAKTAWISEVDAAVALNAQNFELSAQKAVASIAFVRLAEAGSIDDVTAGEHAELFAPWVPDVKYEAGNLRQYDGQLWRCIQAHTSQADWTPDAATSLWVKAADPAEEWPTWSQPIGAQDAYAKGDKVSYKDKHWTSDVESNVWEPGVYGWTEKGE